MKKERAKLVIIFILSLIGVPVKADFRVLAEEDVVVVDPCILQQPCVKGNAQTCRYRRAVLGGDPLSLAEEAKLLALLPLKEAGHYYGRVSLNTSALAYTNIKNTSSFPWNSGAPLSRRFHRNQIGLELAIGYFFDSDTRLELEYLANRNLVIQSSQAISGFPSNLNATIKTNPLLFNFYWEYSGFDRIKPYIVLGLGPSINSVNSSLNGLPGRNMNTVNFAWDVGVGVRMRMFSRWSIDAAYRYINLATRLFIQPPNIGTTTFSLQGVLSLSAFRLGVMYMF